MLKLLFKRLFLLIAYPSITWRKIVKEQLSEKEVRSNFVYPLIGIVTLSALLGTGFTNGIASAVRQCSITFVSYLLGYLSASFLLNEILERFELCKDLERCQVFVGYSSCVIYALSIIIQLHIVPTFLFLQIFYFYTIFVIWESMGIYFKINEQYKIAFTAVCSLLVLLCPAIIYFALSMIMPNA